MKSNLRIRSNVYPIDHDILQKIRERRQIPVPKFIKQLRGKSALKKMADFVHGEANHYDIYKKWLREIGVEEWQIKLYWKNPPCSRANGRHPHGLIEPGLIGCRCKNNQCKHFDKSNNKCGI